MFDRNSLEMDLCPPKANAYYIRSNSDVDVLTLFRAIDFVDDKIFGELKKRGKKFKRMKQSGQKFIMNKKFEQKNIHLSENVQ